MNAPSSASSPHPSGLQSLQNTWQNIWGQRSAREQLLLSWASSVLVLAAVWSLALAPALRTWQEAPDKQAQLDAQSQRMRQLQLQAQSLQKPQTLSRAEASQWLENSLSSLGPNAQLSLQGERATLRVQAAPAEALARWLRQARENAQALPLQAQLQQTQAPSALAASQPSAATRSVQAAGSAQDQAITPAPSMAKGDALWRGSMELRLP